MSMFPFPCWKNYINDVEDQEFLRDYNNISTKNPDKKPNLVILACKHNKVKVLEYLLQNMSTTACDVSVGIRGGICSTLLLDEEDESCHNAFYYAIRSGNVELLETLINKWPDKYFDTHYKETDEIISGTYEELKIKNIPLSDEMEVFVENKLLNIRFFSIDGCVGNVKSDHCNTWERIELVHQHVSQLKIEYSNTETVDEKFLFIAKCIAQNIHVLKRMLKSSYDQIPWEEMEFCLISFVSSHTSQQEMNLFYSTILIKSKMLNHLVNFAQKLKEDKSSILGLDSRKISSLPKLNREKLVADILKRNPHFDELYSDYQQIRDIYSLVKINDSLKLALLSDPREREGQLTITRVLQVIGEYLKNTLESPKLSTSMSELLLLSLPQNTRKVIIDLRNSLSHASSLFKRTEMEENADGDFFIGIQNDIKQIDGVVTNILYNTKVRMVRILLNKIISSECLEELKEFAEMFNNVKLDEIVTDSFKGMNLIRIKNLIYELRKNIPDKTNDEKELFNKIDYIINFEKSKSKTITTDYNLAFLSLISLFVGFNDNKIDHNIIRRIKFFAKTTLNSIPSQMESHNLKEIAEVSREIWHSVRFRTPNDNISRLICEIFYIAQSETSDLKWIEEFRHKIIGKVSFIPVSKQIKAMDITEEKYNKQLELRLTELKNILRYNALSGKLKENILSYKRDKSMQSVVEMLVLDIMSILGRSENYLENNLLFLDESTPILTGKCLRNHLAHDNIIVNILLSNPSIAVILNAKKLILENVTKVQRKIGKFVKDVPSKLKDKYEKNFFSINNQKKMFESLEEGNLDNIKNCLGKGADIHARNIHSSTTLHFAARGPSLEVVQFLLDNHLPVNVKDVNGQSPLHIAAVHGRNNIVDYFIREAGIYVDDLDNGGKTPLHMAAGNGHKDTVEVLLTQNANTDVKDNVGFSPLHYAIKKNHIDVVKVLLKKEENVDVNEAMGGFTSLHLAAENGDLELVNFLLGNGANVNAITDREVIPLHTAALFGHLEVVNALITNGSNVNARVMDGCTPLHYAIECGYGEVANILLKHGANVNAIDKIYNNTPLHYAAKDGYEEIVENLLTNKANVNSATVEGITPLHFAVGNGHLKIATILLKYGANIYAKAKNNATPLHHAVENGNMAVTECLIKFGSNINDKVNNSQTPLHIASMRGHTNIIKLLIKNKAEIMALDGKGNTPLHYAAKIGKGYNIDLLLRKDAEIEARNDSGMTPLHVAALRGNKDAVDLLIKNKAEVNTSDFHGITPLNAAIVRGHTDVVDLLIKEKAKVEVEDITENAPLHLAVEAGHMKINKSLVAKGARVNDTSVNKSPLISAITNNHKEIVKILVENGANVNTGNGKALSIAALLGYSDIVDILLQNKAYINLNGSEEFTPLHLAARSGHKKIVNDLISKGANVDAMTNDKITPLYLAAEGGHEDIVEILIANCADVNIVNTECCPLYAAAVNGHVKVVEILLRNGAKVKNRINSPPLEVAVKHGHLEVVKLLLQHKEVDMNCKGNDDWTILHIASQKNNLDMIQFLVDAGCDINAKNASGSKPIHIAATEGCIGTVKFFINKGLNVDEIGSANLKLLHYAAIKGQIDVAEYLIAQGADINAKDDNGDTPMHVAANMGCKGIIEVLLKNGALYDMVDNFYKSPLQMTNNNDIITLLSSTEQLFKSVKHDSSSVVVENVIRSGAFINAKNSNDGTPLHYAAWKGNDRVVKILLQNKANPNAVTSMKLSPLHYAAKFSHLKTVQALLFHGAVYDALSNSGKTPSDLTVDKHIDSLFKLISKSFEKVKIGYAQLINDLNKIKDIDTVKAVMSARNRDNKTLVVVALLNNFPKVHLLKKIAQNDISAEISTAISLMNQGQYQGALSIFRSTFERRKEILGPDNPGTLDIQSHIATVLYKQGKYQEALNMLEEIYENEKEMLGFNAKETLRTKCAIALVLHRQGKDRKAFNIYQEVYHKQKKILGSNHTDTLNSKFHMALVLDSQGKYEEALQINKEVFVKMKATLGTYDKLTVSALNNIAMVLDNQGKHQESINIFKEVFEMKKITLGINHADTLRTLHNIAKVLSSQNKCNEAMQGFHEVLLMQRNALQHNHPDTLNTQYNMANLLFNQGKLISALKIYTESFDQIKEVFGENHPIVFKIKKVLEIINLRFKFEGKEPSTLLLHLQKDINIAASKDDVHTVQRLLKNGADANDKDIDGRTPLHCAVGNGHINVINTLLKNGADVTQITNKGNTPLHTAAFNGYTHIVEVLLQHIGRDKMNDFVNAKTTFNGATSLHVAAKAGYWEIVKSLLKHGATYNILNKEGQTPFDLSKDQNITRFLNLLDQLFSDITDGNIGAIGKLKAVKHDEFIALINARNNLGNTLLQVAITNKHKDIAGKLLNKLKEQQYV